jgi:hypothetical protein
MQHVWLDIIEKRVDLQIAIPILNALTNSYSLAFVLGRFRIASNSAPINTRASSNLFFSSAQAFG